MMTREPRPNTDPESRDNGGPDRMRVVLLTEAEPNKPFKVKRLSRKRPPSDWDPESAEADEHDLWSETDETISNVMFDLKMTESLSAGTHGWIVFYEGYPYLYRAECS